MYSAQNSNTFLAYFNQIDKYLSKILWLKKYVPYHERVTMITTGKTSISRFVRMFEDKLRYFGDLRNQLVHGFRLENKHYLIVSNHALDEIQSIHDDLTQPQSIASLAQQPAIAQQSDLLQPTLQLMSDAGLRYIPVYDSEQLIGVLWFQDIMHWLVSQDAIDTPTQTVWDVDVTHYAEYRTISSRTSVYEVQEMFEQDTAVEVLLITADSSPDSAIQGMVTIYDLPGLLWDI